MWNLDASCPSSVAVLPPELSRFASLKEPLNGALEGFRHFLRRCLLETPTLIGPVRLSSKLTVTLDTGS